MAKEMTVFKPSTALVKIANEIRAEISGLRKNTAENITAIGKLLVAAREQCPHGEWYPWLASEFDWSRQTADNFINVFTANFKTPIIRDLDTTALYLLAKPNCPPKARSAVEKLVHDGNAPTISRVRELIEKFKPKAKTDDKSEAEEAAAEHQREEAEAEGFSPEEIWSRGLLARAKEAVADAAFEKSWLKQFKATSQHVHAAKRAAKAWEELAAFLESMS